MSLIQRLPERPVWLRKFEAKVLETTIEADLTVNVKVYPEQDPDRDGDFTWFVEIRPEAYDEEKYDFAPVELNIQALMKLFLASSVEVIADPESVLISGTPKGAPKSSWVVVSFWWAPDCDCDNGASPEMLN